ncbi:hypothetical protein ACVWYG_002426 [Pedobacter sp. UYEF25]
MTKFIFYIDHGNLKLAPGFSTKDAIRAIIFWYDTDIEPIHSSSLFCSHGVEKSISVKEKQYCKL